MGARVNTNQTQSFVARRFAMYQQKTRLRGHEHTNLIGDDESRTSLKLLTCHEPAYVRPQFTAIGFGQQPVHRKALLQDFLPDRGKFPCS